MALIDTKCVPCEGGTLPLTIPEATKLHEEITEWTLARDVKKISRTFTFRDFKEALAFTNRIGAIAEEEGHHPDIVLSWGKVNVDLTTHAIGGLSINDFILAAKIDKSAHK